MPGTVGLQYAVTCELLIHEEKDKDGINGEGDGLHDSVNHKDGGGETNSIGHPPVWGYVSEESVYVSCPYGVIVAEDAWVGHLQRNKGR